MRHNERFKILKINLRKDHAIKISKDTGNDLGYKLEEEQNDYLKMRKGDMWVGGEYTIEVATKKGENGSEIMIQSWGKTPKNNEIILNEFIFSFQKKVANEEKLKAEKEVICPTCNKSFPKTISFCPNDGTPLVLVCSKCGNKLQIRSAFCPSCGAPADTNSKSDYIPKEPIEEDSQDENENPYTELKQKNLNKWRPLVALMGIVVGLISLVSAYNQSQLSNSERTIRSVNNFSKEYFGSKLTSYNHDYSITILLSIFGVMMIIVSIIYLLKKKKTL